VRDAKAIYFFVDAEEQSKIHEMRRKKRGTRNMLL
jgi:hypothetical protein